MFLLHFILILNHYVSVLYLHFPWTWHISWWLGLLLVILTTLNINWCELMTRYIFLSFFLIQFHVEIEADLLQGSVAGPFT